MSNPNLVSPQVAKQPGLSPKVTVSEESILKQEKKERPLILDPIVISYFSEFHQQSKELLNFLCKAVHDTAQSKPQGGPGG
jgi:hypothetical protein